MLTLVSGDPHPNVRRNGESSAKLLTDLQRKESLIFWRCMIRNYPLYEGVSSEERGIVCHQSQVSAIDDLL
jgi:hypothetical protein